LTRKAKKKLLLTLKKFKSSIYKYLHMTLYNLIKRDLLGIYCGFKRRNCVLKIIVFCKKENGNLTKKIIAPFSNNYFEFFLDILRQFQ